MHHAALIFVGMCFKRQLFESCYDSCMQHIEEPYLRHRRARLVRGLQGKILEVGVGTGVNFEHYSTEAQVIGIEPSEQMLQQARLKLERAPAAANITLHTIGCGDPALETMFEPQSLDYVVCTLVLCTIPDPLTAVRQFKKWLKPGGKLIVLEHIRSEKRLSAGVQDFVNPLWKKVAGGCHLNRATDKMIPAEGFILEQQAYFKIGIPFYEAVYFCR